MKELFGAIRGLVIFLNQAGKFLKLKPQKIRILVFVHCI